jgi:transposase
MEKTIPNPKFLEQSASKIRRLQRELSRKKNNGRKKNKEKAKIVHCKKHGER